MADQEVTAVAAQSAETGRSGESLLARGESLSMRLWDEVPGEQKSAVARDYETVGYVLEGSAEIEAAGQTITVKTGDSWVIPKGATHRYRVLEHFRAVEATHPPAEHS